MASSGEEDRADANGSHLENKKMEEGKHLTGGSSGDPSTESTDAGGSHGEDACGSCVAPCSLELSENLSSPSHSDAIGFSTSSPASSAARSAIVSGVHGEFSFADGLADIFGNPDEGDMLFRQDSGGSKLLTWLRALDQQTIGGCRTDERLKPLFKLNVSGGVVEDHLLAHLRQVAGL